MQPAGKSKAHARHYCGTRIRIIAAKSKNFPIPQVRMRDEVKTFCGNNLSEVKKYCHSFEPNGSDHLPGTAVTAPMEKKGRAKQPCFPLEICPPAADHRSPITARLVTSPL